MIVRNDFTKANDSIGMQIEKKLHEKGRWIGEFSLTKWEFDESIRLDAEADLRSGFSKEQIKFKYGEKAALVSDEVIGRNLLLNSGINSIIAPALAGGSYRALNNANARIGVGDSSTAAAASQTGLVAATNKTYKPMDATYPTYGTSQQIVFRSTFGGSDANYAWAEFIVDDGNGTPIALNRLVSSQGTKTSGQSWQVTLTITFS